MKKTLLLSCLFYLVSFILFISPFLSQAQNWSEPVNISNMAGMDLQPDMTVDKNGTIHCVWSHKMGTNFRKIYYSKSEDDGLTWSEPYDVTQNEEKWMGTPKIVSDTNNKLYVIYQHNTGNYYKTIVAMQSSVYGVWSNYDTISAGQLGTVGNFLEIDQNNRLYAFWYYGHTTFYRIFNNGEWSEIYNTNIRTGGKMFFMDAAADNNNNLHCLFMFRNYDQPSDSSKVAYRKLTSENNWTELEILSSATNNGNEKIGIDVDSTNIPNVAYREVTPWGSAPKPDTTIYRFKDGGDWTMPEIVVTDPKNQKILIDENNKPNVFDVEKLGDNGSMLVHHFKEYSWWESVIIDEVEMGVIQYSVFNDSCQLYTAYSKVEDDMSQFNIYFSKTSLLTTLRQNKNHAVFNIKLFPNPFNSFINISFETAEVGHVSVKIYEYNGRLVKTLLDKDINKGKHQFNWNGSDNNGNTIPPGHYILRLRQGNRIVSKPVTFIK